MYLYKIMLYKMHPISYFKDKVYMGLTIPDEIAQFFSGCYFNIEFFKINEKIGIMCSSGCNTIPEKKEIENYKYDGIKI